MKDDRKHGFNEEALDASLKQAHGSHDEGHWSRTLDSSDPGDPFGYSLKPQDVKVWEKTPITEEEKAIYAGLHIHTESNPLGLHSHLPGGKLGGAHTHGPSNRFGSHTHADITDDYEIYSVDGKHTHEYGVNKPCGEHQHHPNSFG